jgi:hypothetical protein
MAKKVNRASGRTQFEGRRLRFTCALVAAGVVLTAGITPAVAATATPTSTPVSPDHFCDTTYCYTPPNPPTWTLSYSTPTPAEPSQEAATP